VTHGLDCGPPGNGDHVANASLFAGSTWIVQKGDRDPILAPRPAGSRVPDPKFFEGLANSKTVLLNGEDHDVFGDGTGADREEPRDDRRIRETEPRTAVDPARLHHRD
jgi:hypothetical protein